MHWPFTNVSYRHLTAHHQLCLSDIYLFSSPRCTAAHLTSTHHQLASTHQSHYFLYSNISTVHTFHRKDHFLAHSNPQPIVAGFWCQLPGPEKGQQFDSELPLTTYEFTQLLFIRQSFAFPHYYSCFVSLQVTKAFTPIEGTPYCFSRNSPLSSLSGSSDSDGEEGDKARISNMASIAEAHKVPTSTTYDGLVALPRTLVRAME